MKMYNYKIFKKKAKQFAYPIPVPIRTDIKFDTINIVNISVENNPLFAALEFRRLKVGFG